MRCDGCGAMVGRWSASPLCPACHTIAGAALPIPVERRRVSAMWLWASDDTRAALASGDLAPSVARWPAVMESLRGVRG
jgi:hypothetical protein